MSHLQVVFALVVKGQALCSALALVIAAALANGVDIPPIVLSLGVLQRVAIDLQIGQGPLSNRKCSPRCTFLQDTSRSQGDAAGCMHLQWLATESQLTQQLRQLRATGRRWLSYTCAEAALSCRAAGCIGRQQHSGPGSWGGVHLQGSSSVTGLDSSSPALQAVPSQAAPCARAGFSRHSSRFQLAQQQVAARGRYWPPGMHNFQWAALPAGLPDGADAQASASAAPPLSTDKATHSATRLLRKPDK